MQFPKSSHFKYLRLLLASSREKGFTMPLVMGMGLILILMAQTMLVRSGKDKAGAQSSTAVAKDLSAAEVGITRFQSLIQNNRAIATYSDCAGSRNSSGVCPDTSSTKSWSNAGSIPGVSGGAVTAVANSAQTSWKAIDASDSSKGQFRLVSYKFSADNPSQPDQAPGKGTLVVEGRGDNQAASATRLAVTFKITPGGSPTTLNGEGLWISCNSNSSTSNSGSEIQTNVADSTSVSADNPPGSGTTACTNSTSSIDALKLQQKVNGVVPTPPFTYSTGTQKFPPMPTEGLLANVPGTGVCTTSNTIGNAVTLPAPCNHAEIGGSGSGTYNTYHLTGSKAINFTGGGDILTVDAPGQTVKLYLNNELTITHSGAGIVVTPGTTLVIYAHGPITLNGGSGIGGPLSNPGTADNIQIYQYVSDELRLTGGSGAKAFIFAPLAKVSMTGGSAIGGAIWARAYSATGGSDVIGSAGTIDCSNLPSGYCSGGGTNQISSVQTWSRNSRN